MVTAIGGLLIWLSQPDADPHPAAIAGAVAAEQPSILWEVVGALGEALLIAGIFTFAFELVGKKKLIEEAVEQAAGQVRAVSFGLFDFVETPREIDYDDAFEMSSTLVVSSRYSADALSPHRHLLINRFKAGRKLIFLREKTLDRNLPARPGRGRQSVDSFLEDLLIRHPEFLSCIDFWETDRPFMYNFVVIDEGIWIKLYYNAPSDDPPPAFFTKRNSQLHKLYQDDIDRLLEEADPVDPSIKQKPGESGD